MKWEPARWLACEMNIHLYALARKGCSSTLLTVLLRILFGPTVRVVASSPQRMPMCECTHKLPVSPIRESFSPNFSYD